MFQVPGHYLTYAAWPTASGHVLLQRCSDSQSCSCFVVLSLTFWEVILKLVLDGFGRWPTVWWCSSMFIIYIYIISLYVFPIINFIFLFNIQYFTTFFYSTISNIYEYYILLYNCIIKMFNHEIIFHHNIFVYFVLHDTILRVYYTCYYILWHLKYTILILYYTKRIISCYIMVYLYDMFHVMHHVSFISYFSCPYYLICV